MWKINRGWGFNEHINYFMCDIKDWAPLAGKDQLHSGVFKREGAWEHGAKAYVFNLFLFFHCFATF